MRYGQVFITAVLLGAFLLSPLASTQAGLISPDQTTQTFTVTITSYTTETFTSMSYVVNSFTQFRTITDGGLPPQVSINGIQWSPPTLSFYVQNSGGSGTVTIAIFDGDFLVGTYNFHVDAYSSTPVYLNFSGYMHSEQLRVQVVGQAPDSSAVRTESSVVYATETYAANMVRTNMVELRQTVTSVLGNPNNPATDSGGQQVASFPLPYVAASAVILALAAVFFRARKGTRREARGRIRRRGRRTVIRRVDEEEDKTRVYD